MDGDVGEAVFTKNGRVYMKRITPVSSYYYNYFVNGHIYRKLLFLQICPRC